MCQAKKELPTKSRMSHIFMWSKKTKNNAHNIVPILADFFSKFTGLKQLLCVRAQMHTPMHTVCVNDFHNLTLLLFLSSCYNTLFLFYFIRSFFLYCTFWYFDSIACVYWKYLCVLLFYVFDSNEYHAFATSKQ